MKKENILLGTACFFAGVVAGFMIAPIKNGIFCGNNNGNNNYYKEDNDEREEQGELSELNKQIDEAINQI